MIYKQESGEIYLPTINGEKRYSLKDAESRKDFQAKNLEITFIGNDYNQNRLCLGVNLKSISDNDRHVHGHDFSKYKNRAKKKRIAKIFEKPIDYLLFAIKVLTKVKNPQSEIFYKENPDKFKQDIEHALDYAAEKGMSIAYYYKAKALCHFSKKNEKINDIKCNYKQAEKALHAADSFIIQFDHWVPQLTEELKSTKYTQVTEDLKRELDAIEKNEEKIQQENNPVHIKKEIKKDTKLTKEKGEQLDKLAQHENNLIHYYLLAACCGNTNAQQQISNSHYISYFDIAEHVACIKETIKDAHSFTGQYNIVHCYLAIYNIYSYFHGKEKENKLQEQDQISRQVCFVKDLHDLSKLKFKTKELDTIQKLMKHVEESGAERGLVKTTYYLPGFWEGTQDFQDLRDKLPKAATCTSLIALQKAAQCFLKHFHSKATVSGHLLEKIHNNTAFILVKDGYVEDKKEVLASDFRHNL